MNSHGPEPHFSGLRVYRQLDSETALFPVGADRGLRRDPSTATATRHPGRCPGPPARFRNAVLENGAAFGYYVRGMAFTRLGSQKYLDFGMEPIAIIAHDQLGKLHGTHSGLVSEVHPKIGLRPERSHAG